MGRDDYASYSTSWSPPLNIPGAVGSPLNPIAIK